MSSAPGQATGELQQLLDRQREKSAAKTPPEIGAVMKSAVADLAASGIVEQSHKEGAQAPDFALPNLRGEPVQLSALLAKGPAVVAFYRGNW